MALWLPGLLGTKRAAAAPGLIKAGRETQSLGACGGPQIHTLAYTSHTIIIKQLTVSS
jgi:hypothetical protein